MKSDLIFDKDCPKTCPFYNKPWPSNKRKSLCRLMREHNSATNPVTKAVYRDICENRLERGEPPDCTALDRK